MSKDMTLPEFQSLGGKTTLNRHGKKHFSEAGKKGALAKIQKDPDYYKKLSRAGVEARLKKKAEAKQRVKEDSSPISRVVKILTGKST